MLFNIEKLEDYWKHSDCPLREKLITYDAVIRSKLMYGLESAHLNTNTQRKNRRLPKKRTKTDTENTNNIRTTHEKPRKQLHKRQSHKVSKRKNQHLGRKANRGRHRRIPTKMQKQKTNNLAQ